MPVVTLNEFLKIDNKRLVFISIIKDSSATITSSSIYTNSNKELFIIFFDYYGEYDYIKTRYYQYNFQNSRILKFTFDQKVSTQNVKGNSKKFCRKRGKNLFVKFDINGVVFSFDDNIHTLYFFANFNNCSSGTKEFVTIKQANPLENISSYIPSFSLKDKVFKKYFSLDPATKIDPGPKTDSVPINSRPNL